MGICLVQKAPASTIEVLAKACSRIVCPYQEIILIGTRHGEKLYETLITSEECLNAENMAVILRISAIKEILTMINIL